MFYIGPYIKCEKAAQESIDEARRVCVNPDCTRTGLQYVSENFCGKCGHELSDITDNRAMPALSQAWLKDHDLLCVDVGYGISYVPRQNMPSLHAIFNEHRCPAEILSESIDEEIVWFKQNFEVAIRSIQRLQGDDFIIAWGVVYLG